jgi:hypothetical protein
MKENLRVTKYNYGIEIPLDTSGGYWGNEPRQTWTNRTLPASGLWSAIGWSGVSFVTIAAGGTIAATSPTGTTWTQRTLPSTNNVVDTCIAALNGVFIAVQYGSQTAFKSTS